MALEGMTRAVDEGKGRMGELWRGVGELKSRVNGSGRGMGWGVADEEGLRQILEVSPRFWSSPASRTDLPFRFFRHNRRDWIT